MSRPSIFITGAATGIGRATAARFAGAGWRVGLFDLDREGVASLQSSMGEGAVSGALDVRDPGQFQSALRQFTAATGGRLDVLFNNAGVVAVGDFESIPLERHHDIVDVNYKGVLNGAHCALPWLRSTPGARMINMASASAIYGSPSYASYSGTKFAVRGLTEALNIEWRRHGITVMDVLPLFVNTAMVTEVEAPRSLERMGVRLQPDDVAATVWRAAHWPRWWPRVHWYPGAQTWGMALAHKLSPAWLNRWTTRLITGY